MGVGNFTICILVQSCRGKSKQNASTTTEVKIPIPTVTLNNGIKMPVLGFSTLELHGTTGENSITEAISLGYRLFYTATIYGNDETVGKGIKKLFVTTKLWVDDMGYESAKDLKIY